MGAVPAAITKVDGRTVGKFTAHDSSQEANERTQGAGKVEAGGGSAQTDGADWKFTAWGSYRRCWIFYRDGGCRWSSRAL